MDNKMFCFQCEQTARCSGCTSSVGVCGKSSKTAELQDNLVGDLIALALTVNQGKDLEDNISDEVIKTVLEGLFTTITNVNFNDETLEIMIEKVKNLRKEVARESKVEEAQAYDMKKIWYANEDIRSLKSLILFGIKGMAAYAYHAWVINYRDDEVNKFFIEALCELSKDNSLDNLLKTVMKTGEINLKCMALLDKANTSTFGKPQPAKVSLTVEKGPFIVVTGHDLNDLKLLLEQTKDKGINIYTHGEMLPAHGYPELRKYEHLKGNFGTAWQNQQKEFANVPGAFLFTTNCLMPVKDSYADRVFTTEVVSYPQMIHIGEEKDFTPVINKALELGGYEKDMEFTGINGGHEVITGFGHDTVISVVDKVIDAVKAGKIKHFFLVGGCDGAKVGRNYYTEFVKATPKDTVILTLACGKYRFNDLNLGEIEGLPRIMDMGQCNDAYSAIQVAVALANAFGCGVNELPLTLNISWYEQKAVCILLSLLHLGIKNILLGPTIPAFISKNVLNILVENYNIAPISTPEEDLRKALTK
ncbi:hydroxylamine reductase [Lachnobacterium bovis]|uniref:Hydroxylamine reductase n=1 Tax=Lachnobacterium bovis DSM 14045 TaxID=1122142 RepID=A0A1H3EUU1_9FIRM|nr:hydroxylamine reductase [Lachnobacterium bovis]SDX82327.1 hydroxylamine reductase [Lachnobacterium bovis DSM 14045]